MLQHWNYPYPQHSKEMTTYNKKLCCKLHCWPSRKRCGTRGPLAWPSYSFSRGIRNVLLIIIIKKKWRAMTDNTLFSYLGHVCFLEFTFQEITFQTFLCLFVIRKVGQRKTLSGQRKHFSVNEKHFPVKGKFSLVFRKVFSWKIWAENTFQKLWKI